MEESNEPYNVPYNKDEYFIVKIIKLCREYDVSVVRALKMLKDIKRKDIKSKIKTYNSNDINET